MNRFILCFFFVLSSIGTFAQEHQFLNERETIVENGVYKMIQYDVLDSAGFAHDYANGYYSIYNEEGLKIKSNAYRSYFGKGRTKIHEEYINYYMYNSLNEQIGLIQMFPEADEPFEKISLKSISHEENSIHTAILESDMEGDDFIFKEYEYSPTIKALKDTIKISEFHSRSYSSFDSLIYVDIYYSKNGSIDSTEFHSRCDGKLRGATCSTSTAYRYFSNGNVSTKFIEYRSSTSELNPYLTKEVRYLENGLIDSIKSSYLNPSIDDTTWYRFEYQIREDQ